MNTGELSNSTGRVKHSARPCPVCGTARGEVLFRQSFHSLEQVGLLDGYDVVLCSTCGVAYADDIPSQAEFDAYYRDLSKYEHAHRDGKESPDDERRLQEVALDLQSMIAEPTSRLLEIGCANGRLLSLLREMGFPNVFGADPSPASAEVAHRLYDIPVTTTTIFDLSRCAGRYDYVVMLGVLEHIRDVGAAIHSVKSVLSDAGRVYIEVPDATHPTIEQDAPFQEFSLEHINFFSPASLQQVMEGAGFRALTCGSVEREPRQGVFVRVVRGMFECGAKARACFPRHADTEAALRAYVSQCRLIEDRLRSSIARAVGDGAPIVVWGVGTHTRRLLATGALASANIVAFVDSNPKYQGRRLHNLPILSPQALCQRREAILILSFAFQQEIRRQIQDELKLSNKVITLY